MRPLAAMSRMPHPARSKVKTAVESLLFRAGPARLGRALLRGRTAVFAWHNVVPRGAPVSGERSLHLPLADFEAQIDLLRRTHDVVPLEGLLQSRTGRNGTGNGSRPALPRAVITFDDAYRGAVTVGVRALAARGLPATIFVAPGLLNGHAFWWDAVPEEEAAAFRPHALEELGGRDRAVRNRMRERGWRENALPDHQRAATLAELRDAVRNPGIRLASHSWSHPNLARLAPDALDAELARPLAWLEDRFPGVLRWISWPYGISTPAVEEAARRAGYRGALRISGGWVPAEVRNAYALPRMNVPAKLSLEGFGVRSAGLLCGR